MTEETKFTPSPWKAAKSNFQGANKWDITALPKRGLILIAICGSRLANNKANARLIAQAPAMYEVLKELEWICESIQGADLLCCPSCRVVQIEGGHKDDCKLLALIEAVENQ